MKRLAFLGSVLLLAACAPANTAFELTLDETGRERRQETLDASVRVVTRRLETLGQKMRSRTVVPTASGAILRFALALPAHQAALAQELQNPLSFRIMIEATEEEAVVWNERAGGFGETGITERDVLWATATPAADGKQGNVLLEFTPEGRQKLAKLIAENQGKKLGIFVRGLLITYKRIGPGDASASIPIDNVPSVDLAAVFADDVNVGTHVTFTPLQASSP